MPVIMVAIASFSRPTMLRGRRRTALLLVQSSIAFTMTLISDLAPRWAEPPLPTFVPTIVVGDGPVVALRHRPVVAPGALTDRALVHSDRLVSAQDLPGAAWWIPAAAVWSDADGPQQPQHPRPVGLATARTREHAMLAGLSDRLGWEAVAELERGRELPAVEGLIDSGADELVVLDGRLDHDVPTVVILGHDLERWGAGATWPVALHRALYGDDGSVGGEGELAELASLLHDRGLGVVAVDLGTPLIRRAGVVRYSVQLLVTNDDPGRRWDASEID